MLSDLLWFIGDIPVHLTDIPDITNNTGITECNDTGASQKHWIFMVRQMSLQYLSPENVAMKGNHYAILLCSVRLLGWRIVQSS